MSLKTPGSGALELWPGRADHPSTPILRIKTTDHKQQNINRIIMSATRLSTLSRPMNKLPIINRLALMTPQYRRLSTSSTSYSQPSPIVKADSAADAPYVRGTINDPTTFPPPSKAHGSIHWTFERSVAASLIPLSAATAISSANPILDGVIGVFLIAHSHMGFDQCLVDYVPKRKFPVISPIATWTLRALTCGVLVGVYQFNTHDIGMTELIKKAWKA
ncbi:succinate dehydrogenase (ubiquinone) membrane anchor subunit [Puccinia graminis f. sp. tritici CRL 75-36-700-3]|uniref:Succinate dehydrogenase [ubiquinone] cytochrome b small subunit n=1 Tax=Puccinia graminis f. sp. tritici (strain CRL 75-36-700-3 / race SCCL) TaxID=418459 RepID=E3KKC7_PUCGT|nr:succinate dehydrogenase (ubiquinone) membrane anchor subunit [Puccinia graminis f. sp. tritici CRL 75-36-700-3]EFP84752.1 succinate dehydrogenase (ubiquinone) membrane anchor subunit [Puccinia graminis f. sp. tritici CRL 75-36-700-3]